MIKKLLISASLCTCLCCGCVNGDAPGNVSTSVTTVAGNETTAAGNETASNMETTAAVSSDKTDSKSEAMQNTGLTEEDLVKLLEDTCGTKLEAYAYEDFDMDGTKELLGAFAKNYMYETWYCSSDGKICKKVLSDTIQFDACQIDLIKHENAIHAAVNTYNLIGNYKTFAILALQNGEITCLAANQNGYAGMDQADNLCVTIEGYDGFLDATIGQTLGHTWKTTYITFDEKSNTYLEIPAKPISEAEFLSFTNGKEALDAIKKLTQSATPAKTEYTFFKRSNGFVHVQCAEYDTANNIAFYYFTLSYEGNTFTHIPVESLDGIMSEQFTEFKATK